MPRFYGKSAARYRDQDIVPQYDRNPPGQYGGVQDETGSITVFGRSEGDTPDNIAISPDDLEKGIRDQSEGQAEENT
jgi:hypothetical protein